MHAFSCSLFPLFLALNAGHGDEIAIRTSTRTYTKDEVKQDVLRYAKHLDRLGLHAGHKIVIAAENRYACVIAFLAANALGIATVYLSSAASIAEIASFANRHYARFAILNESSTEDDFQELYQRSGNNMICAVNVKDIEPCVLRNDFGDSTRIWTKMLKQVRNTKPLIYLQTSGSSGKPKTMGFTNRNFVASLLDCSDSTGIQVRDPKYHRCICIMPFRLPYGWSMVFVNLIGGQEVVLADSSAPEDLANLWRTCPDFIYGTPTILRDLIDHSPEEANWSSLKVFFSGGCSTAPPLFRQAVAYFAAHSNSEVQICNNYGFSEGLCIGTNSLDIPYFEGSVGKFFVNDDWRIVDENLNPVPPGTEGEIIVSSDALCHGYWQNPDQTSAHFFEREGKWWYRSGDRAYQTNDGLVMCPNRGSFFLPSGAKEKVYCAPIEQFLVSLNYVADAAVLSPDGLSAVAFIELAPNASRRTFSQQIHTLLNETFSAQAAPSELFFTTLPRLAESGKIDRVKLLALLHQEVNGFETYPFKPTSDDTGELPIQALADEIRPG